MIVQKTCPWCDKETSIVVADEAEIEAVTCTLCRKAFYHLPAEKAPRPACPRCSNPLFSGLCVKCLPRL